jgi:hypothetical protein
MSKITSYDRYGRDGRTICEEPGKGYVIGSKHHDLCDHTGRGYPSRRQAIAALIEMRRQDRWQARVDARHDAQMRAERGPQGVPIPDVREVAHD